MSSQKRKHRTLFLFIGAFGLLILLSILSLQVGSQNIKLSELASAMSNPENTQYGHIIYEYRIPRLLIAMMVGICLAIAGTIFQGVLRNPLASNDVLGIGKGAGFAACLTLSLPIANKMPITVAAMIGGLAVGIFIYGLTRKTGFQNTNVIIMGVAISALCDAGIQYLNFTNKGNVQTVFVWLTGSVWGRYWDEVLIILPFIVIIVPLSLLMARKIDLLALGDGVATNLGEKVGLIRLFLLFLGILLTTGSVAVSGTIGFVGLVAPHIAKHLIGHKHSLVMPFSGLVGAILLVGADTVGRGLFKPLELPVGVVTALVGAPYFLYLLLRKKSMER